MVANITIFMHLNGPQAHEHSLWSRLGVGFIVLLDVVVP